MFFPLITFPAGCQDPPPHGSQEVGVPIRPVACLRLRHASIGMATSGIEGPPDPVCDGGSHQAVLDTEGGEVQLCQ